MKIHVAVGVVLNSKKEVLVALRSHHLDQGGLWEFPGGKVEANETVIDALKRELFEEVGITVVNAESLIIIHHSYPQKNVLLDVWHIKEYLGEPYAKETQEKIKWVNLDELATLKIPAANHEIVKKILSENIISHLL